ncbi:MAG: hypothetical protein V4635_16960 [Bacteroidota bacterium]
MVLLGLVFSSIVVSNNCLPRSEIFVKAPVKSYHAELTRNGRQIHHIKFYEKRLGRLVQLTVNRPYQLNEIFEKELSVGHWGLLYSTK